MTLPLTARSEQALKLAGEEARSMSHNHYGTGHLLLGLIKEEAGVAANILRQVGMEVATVRSCLQNFINTDNSSQASPRLSFVDEAIIRAINEAEKLGHKAVGTEHLLLGLLGKPGWDSNRVFSHFQVKEEQVRDEVMKLLGKEPKEEDVFERFTDRARKSLQLANAAAQKNNQEIIDTLHLFLGMLQEGSGMACKAMLDVGATNCLTRLKQKTENELLLTKKPDIVSMGKLPQSPMVKAVIERAIAEARELKTNYIGSEHLLLGLLHNNESYVRAILAIEGITWIKVRTWFNDYQKGQLRARQEEDKAQQDTEKKEENDLVAEGLSRRVDDSINMLVEYEIQKRLKEEREKILKYARGTGDADFVRWLQHRIEGKIKIGEWSVTMVIGTPVIEEDWPKVTKSEIASDSVRRPSDG